MQTITSQNIQKVKLSTLNKKQSAFIASMLYNLNIEPANIDKVQLVCDDTDNTIFLNEDWFNSYETQHQASILVHEILHYTLQHDLRMGRRDPELYQKACDQVVNNLLLDMGYELPPQESQFTKTKYHNIALESVYKDIEEEFARKKEKEPDSKPSDLPSSSFGSDLNTNNLPSSKEVNKRNQQILNADMANQAQGHKSIGESGDVFSKLFKDIKDGSLNWVEILAGYVDEISQNEISYHTFNRRYLPLGLYLPDVKGFARIGKVALAFDVSGSVSEDEARAFLAEIRKIRADINPEVMSITTFNHKIVAQFEIQENDSLDEVTMDISGGTALTPVFDYYNKEQNKPNFLIVFSDMYVHDFPEQTDYPVIWISINNPNPNIPFGKTIHITSEDLING